MFSRTRFATMAVITALMGTATLTAFAGPAAGEFGPNLVRNGSFEAHFSGWTVSGGFITEFVDYFLELDPAHAQSEIWSFVGAETRELGFISQNIATTSGGHYNIHLWLANFGPLADFTQIQVLWGGIPVYSAEYILGDYREIIVDPIATDSSTVLSIGLRAAIISPLHIDNISVRAVPEVAVPEPASLALLCLGLAGLGFIRRRKA